MANIKFLGLHINETLPWQFHIAKLVTTMSSGCYAIRAVKGLMSQVTFKMIHFANVHSIMMYGIILGGGNSPKRINVFWTQKRITKSYHECKN
jgi:hypothetical protein